jgi:hypothetical protein
MVSQAENTMSPVALSANGSPMTSQANVYGGDMMGNAGMINPMMLMGNNNGMNMGAEGGNDLANYQAMMMMMMQQQQRSFNGDSQNQM